MPVNLTFLLRLLNRQGAEEQAPETERPRIFETDGPAPNFLEGPMPDFLPSDKGQGAAVEKEQSPCIFETRNTPFVAATKHMARDEGSAVNAWRRSWSA